MVIRFFRGQKTRYEHEHHQLKEIAALLSEDFPDEPVYLLTNVLVANGELDCVILTRNGPLILELKALKGVVRGSENGPWQVEAEDGNVPLPNLFIQAKTHRHDFIDKMKAICRDHFPHINEDQMKKIKSWVYFCSGSSYPDGQIDLRRVKWFQVVNADTFAGKFRFAESGYTLRQEDMDAIVSGLNLEEYSLGNGRKVNNGEGSGKTAGSGWSLSGRRGKILVGILLAIFIISIVPPTHILVVDAVQGTVTATGNLINSITKDVFKSTTTEEESREAIRYLNLVRGANGLQIVRFDPRLFQLAEVRAQDMATYQYLDYTNPKTGLCADNLKTRFGLSPRMYLGENAYGQWNGYTHGIEIAAINSWMTDTGNKRQLLKNYTDGAIACSGGYCSFIGLDPNLDSVGCQAGP